MLAVVFGLFFLFLLIGVPVAYVVLWSAGLGILWDGFAATMIPQQMVGGINSFIMLAVPFFIISGDLAAKGQTSQRLVNVINAFLGHIPGGLGIATIVASAFFGAITGSAIATAVAIGALMLPKLLEAGYPRALSLGIITCSATIGVMIPPSIPLLTMAVAMQVSVGAQFLAGVIPGLLTVAAMSVVVYFEAKRLKIPCMEKVAWGKRFKIVLNSVWALLFPVIILGSIYSGLATPTEAAVISTFYVIVIELFVYRDMSAKELYKLLGPSCVSAATMSLLLATAQVMLYFMTVEHVPELLLNLITGAIDSKIMLLLLLCLLFLVSGCFMNVGSVVIILAPLLIPLMKTYVIDEYQFIVIANIMNQIGMVTPPFGLCLFVSMKMGKAEMSEVIRGSWKLLVAMVVVTILLIAIPELSTWLPSIAMKTM